MEKRAARRSTAVRPLPSERRSINRVDFWPLHLGTGHRRQSRCYSSRLALKTNTLRIDRETREIQQRVRMADHRESLKFDFGVAAQPSDLLPRLNEAKPDIVHFSRHSGQAGLAMEDADG